MRGKETPTKLHYYGQGKVGNKLYLFIYLFIYFFGWEGLLISEIDEVWLMGIHGNATKEILMLLTNGSHGLPNSTMKTMTEVNEEVWKAFPLNLIS